MTPNQKLATFINDQLRVRKWSQRELARRMGEVLGRGVSHATVGYLRDEMSEIKPDLDTLKALAEVFDADPVEILDMTYGLESAAGELSTMATYVGEEFDKLDEAGKKAVLSIIRGWK